MKKTLIIVTLIFFTLSLTSCGMFSPAESLNDKYCDEYPNDTGCKIGEEPTGVIVDEDDSGKTPSDSENPNDIENPVNLDDPYRKYDDGIIEYNYDEMTWVREGNRTYYIKEDTGLLHGMYFGTLNGEVNDDELIQIAYYVDGVEVRFVEYYEYPYVEEDIFYVEPMTREHYTYYSDYSQIMEYRKSEYVDEEWMLVEYLRYLENGTYWYTQNFSFQGLIVKNYDENGMISTETNIEYPNYTFYSYFENGSIKEKWEATINTNHYTYDEFIDGRGYNPPFYLYTKAIYEKYRSPGVLEESAVYGVFTQIIREYDENGIITFEKESGYEEYNTLIYKYERFYSDGVLYSETCWDEYTHFYCEDE